MSKVEMNAFEKFPEVREVEVVSVVPNKKELGRLYKKDAAAVAAALEGLCEGDALAMKAKLEAGEEVPLAVGGASVTVTGEQVAIRKETKRMAGRNFTPAVIEPSFGIGRILYCIFEHCYYTRDGDERRTVFRFTPLAAPTKCTVFPLLQRAELNERAEALSAALTAQGLSNTVDCTGASVGKR